MVHHSGCDFLQVQVEMLERRSAVADQKIASLQAAAATAKFAGSVRDGSGGEEAEESDGEEGDNLIWNINAMCILAWKASAAPSAQPPTAPLSQPPGNNSAPERTSGGGNLRRIMEARPTRLLPLWTLRLLPVLIVFFEVRGVPLCAFEARAGREYLMLRGGS